MKGKHNKRAKAAQNHSRSPRYLEHLLINPSIVCYFSLLSPRNDPRFPYH